MIEIPNNCPCCNSELVEVNFLLYCENTACPAKVEARLINFAKALDIKGLGPATVSKLNINRVPELYDFTVDDFIVAVNSEKTGSKIYEAVRSSLNSSIANIIHSFGVPLVGKSVSDKLSTFVSDIADINEDVCKKAGVGPKATGNLLAFLDTEYIQDEWYKIPFKPVSVTKSATNRGVVCITGKLSSFPTKAAAEKMLNEKGYEVSSSLTKSVTILINESGKESQKTKDALARGVTIITNLNKFLGEIT